MIDSLRTAGLAIVPGMSPNKVDEIVAALADRPVYNGHIIDHSMPGGPLSGNQAPVLCHHVDDVKRATHWLEFARRFIPLVREYFGEEPRLHHVNAYYSQNTGTYPYGRDWHRDYDDRKQLAVFMFGTDVMTREDGGFLYLRGTHLTLDDGVPNYAGHVPDPKNVIEVVGPRGTAWVCDPVGLHMGVVPAKGQRLMFWARFSVSLAEI